MSKTVLYSRLESYRDITIPFYTIYNVVDSLMIDGFKDLYRHGYVKMTFGNAQCEYKFSNDCYRTFRQEVDEILGILKEEKDRLKTFELMFFSGSVTIHLTLDAECRYYLNFKTNNKNHFDIVSSYTFDVLDDIKNRKQAIKEKTTSWVVSFPLAFIISSCALWWLLYPFLGTISFYLGGISFSIFFAIVLFLEPRMVIERIIPQKARLDTTSLYDETQTIDNKNRKTNILIKYEPKTNSALFHNPKKGGFGRTAQFLKRY